MRLDNAQLNELKIEIMTSAQINTELERVKKQMSTLKPLIRTDRDAYELYISASNLYLNLMRNKPNHNLKIA